MDNIQDVTEVFKQICIIQKSHFNVTRHLDNVDNVKRHLDNAEITFG